MTQPLKIQSPLAGNPPQDPQYFIPLKAKDGAEVKAADPRATRAMVALMDMNAVIGGAASHYGGPAAFAELMSAAHAYVFNKAKKENFRWNEKFHLVNDAGHCENGLYALKANYGFANLNLKKLKGFRSIDSALTGHGESHLFPEGIMLSNGPLGSAFPQAQGLAMADALAANSRVTITAISDGACMEGEAREAMAAIPGLAQSGKLAPFVLIISDNNTKLSGRIDKESFAMGPTFEALKCLGWKVISLPNGHDLQKCYEVISSAVEEAQARPQTPIAIHAKTIKGIGTKKTTESSSGGHGFPLKSPTELPAFLSEIYDGQEYPKEFSAWIEDLMQFEKEMKAKAVKPLAPEEKIQTGVANALIKARKENLPVVSITSDLPGSTGVAAFRKEFPQDSFDIGVAESNMVSSAAGFSKAGYIPVVDTFAQFGVTKGALPLIMSSLSQSPMICIFSHTGFQDAADGASHQALSYISMVASIPHVEVHALSCSEEAEALVYQAIQKFAKERQAGKTPNTSVFFLGRENFPKKYIEGAQYQLGRAQILKDTSAQFTKAYTLLATGSTVREAVLAADMLKNKSVGAVVINNSFVNQPDLKVITEAIAKTKGQLLIVEDHQKIGGFAQIVTHALVEKGISFSLKTLAVQGEFGQSAYTAQDLYRKHKIDAQAIVEALG